MDLVGEGLDRRHDDGIPGVHAERIDVLHGTHRDARVVGIAHDLILDLLPADEAAFDDDLPDRARAQAGADAFAIVGRRGHDPAAPAAEGEGGTDDRGKADLPERQGRGQLPVLGGGALDDDRRRIRLADPVEQVAEALAILGHLDGLQRRSEEAHLVPFQDACPGEADGEIQGGLPAETGEDPVGALALDDALGRLDRERLEVDHVGDARVGHDRGRIRVQEDRPDALLAESATGLRARVVELGGLADDHGPRADDEDGADRLLRAVRRAGHAPAARAGRRATKRSKTSSASSGPGDPSGWYWTVSMGSRRWRRPSTEPSFRLRWET